MAKQTINIGSAANDGTGSTLREAFDITNDNFTELYGGTGGLFHKIEGTNFTGSLLIGHSTTGTLSSASNNTGIGIGALNSITSGDSNIAIGSNAGTDLTEGVSNILIGKDAGENITTGDYNVAIGHVALEQITNSNKNVGIGAFSLRQQSASGDTYNTAIGYNSGKEITTGTNNTIIGGLAGDALTTGSENIVIGKNALGTEDTGSKNIAIGRKALFKQNYDGNAYNVVVGGDAGVEVTTGVNNTIVGGIAGDSLTTGSNNIVLGYNAEASAVGVSNEVTIGNSSIANVRIPSDSTLKIGASGDLQLEHLSSNSFIKNTAVGDLYIENQVDSGDVIFRSDDGSGGLATYFKLDGSAQLINVSISNGMQFNDNIRIKVGSGTGGDLRIYHNATNSIIENTTGNLIIQNNLDDSDIIFKSDDGSGGITEYFRVDGGITKTVFVRDTKYEDSKKALFGDQDDLQIQHDGTDSTITNITGDLYIKNSADNKRIYFQSDSGSGGNANYFYLDGNASATDSLITTFPDNSKLTLGTGRDLQIFHDGSNSKILNSGGDLKIGVNNILAIQSNGYDENIASFVKDGAVSLYYNNSKKLETTTNGVTITGALTTTGNINSGGHVYVIDGNKFIAGSGEDLQIYHNSTNSNIQNATGNLTIRNDANDADIEFACDDGSGGVTPYITLDGSEVSTKILTQKVIMSNLPTSDPSNAGQLYNDSGVLKVSAG